MEIYKKLMTEKYEQNIDKKALLMKQISTMLSSRGQLTHTICEMIEKNFKTFYERNMHSDLKMSGSC